MIRTSASRPQTVGEGAVNRAQGTVVESAYRGVAVDHVVRLTSGVALLVSQPLGEGTGAGVPAPGGVVAVTWRPDACVLLAE